MLTLVRSFVQLTRPVFLFGGALLYALGAALAHAAGASIDWGRYLFGQVMVTSIQLMTHYANEYFDIECDRACGPNRTWFSGGSGVLADGRLAPGVALGAARVCGVAAMAAILLAAWVEPRLCLVGALALLGGWFYSAPPLRLVASGFGELLTAAMVALLAPLTGLLLQGGAIDARFAAVTLPLILMNLAMQLAFEFPDHDGDRATGKRTLTVRLGAARAARLHHVLLAAGLVSAIAAAAPDWTEIGPVVLLLGAAPLAIGQVILVERHVRRGWRGYAILSSGGIGLFALASAALLAAVLID